MRTKLEILKGCGKDFKIKGELIYIHTCDEGDLCPECQALFQHTDDILELIEKFKGEDFTDKEIWEDMKRELKQSIIGEKT